MINLVEISVPLSESNKASLHEMREEQFRRIMATGVIPVCNKERVVDHDYKPTVMDTEPVPEVTSVNIPLPETPKRIRMESEIIYTIGGEEVSKEEHDAYVSNEVLDLAEEQFWRDVFVSIMPTRNASSAALEATKAVKEYRKFKQTHGH